MCNIIIKYSTNNIFLTVLINNIKIYSKSSGTFLEYKKGKRKISNLALLFLINNFLNFFLLNFKKKIFYILNIKIFGCTLKRFIFLKKNLNLFLSEFIFFNLFFLHKSTFTFNGCKLKKINKKKRRKKRRKQKFN